MLSPAGLVGFSAGRRLQKLSSAPRASARLQYSYSGQIKVEELAIASRFTRQRQDLQPPSSKKYIILHYNSSKNPEGPCDWFTSELRG